MERFSGNGDQFLRARLNNVVCSSSSGSLHCEVSLVSLATAHQIKVLDGVRFSGRLKTNKVLLFYATDGCFCNKPAVVLHKDLRLCLR